MRRLSAWIAALLLFTASPASLLAQCFEDLLEGPMGFRAHMDEAVKHGQVMLAHVKEMEKVGGEKRREEGEMALVHGKEMMTHLQEALASADAKDAAKKTVGEVMTHLERSLEQTSHALTEKAGGPLEEIRRALEENLARAHNL